MLRTGRITARTTLAQAHRKHFHLSSSSHAVLGLVAGDTSRAGFGKPALIPDDVTTLIQGGHKVLVDEKLAKLIPGGYEAVSSDVGENPVPGRAGQGPGQGPGNALTTFFSAQAGACVKARVDTRDCDVVASIAAPSVDDIEPLKRYPNGMQEKPTVFVSFFRLQEQYDEALRSAMLASAADRGSRFVETSKLPGDFAVSAGPIKKCLAADIGAATMRDALNDLKDLCRIRGMHGRVDTLGHDADTVLRKIKKGKSVRQ